LSKTYSPAIATELSLVYGIRSVKIRLDHWSENWIWFVSWCWKNWHSPIGLGSLVRENSGITLFLLVKLSSQLSRPRLIIVSVWGSHFLIAIAFVERWNSSIESLVSLQHIIWHTSFSSLSSNPVGKFWCWKLSLLHIWQRSSYGRVAHWWQYFLCLETLGISHWVIVQWIFIMRSQCTWSFLRFRSVTGTLDIIARIWLFSWCCWLNLNLSCLKSFHRLSLGFYLV